MDENLTPLQRFFLAWVAFFKVLFDGVFAEEVRRVREARRAGLLAAPTAPPAGAATASPRPTAATPPPTPPAPTPPAPTAAAPAAPATPATPAAPAPTAAAAKPLPAATPDGASLHVLALLQRDGRLIDFLSESLEGFSDAEIGAAARTVHAGCRKVIDSYVELEPVYREAEGAAVVVGAGFDPAAVRLTGNVVGAPPFRGTLRHHGWRASRATFPPVPAGQDPRVLAPAEVELA